MSKYKSSENKIIRPSIFSVKFTLFLDFKLSYNPVWVFEYVFDSSMRTKAVKM